MKVARSWPRLAAVTLAIFLAAAVSSAAQPGPTRLPVQPGRAIGGQLVIVDNTQAGEVRSRLNEVLGNYSPSIGQVLKLDPTLLSSADYLAPYPVLAQFLAQHPEVARDPAFFLADVQMPSSERDWNDNDRERQFWRETFGGMLFFLGFLLLAGVLAWLIKTMLDYRRWLRLSKIQADAHNKLLDRFAANEELLGYVSSEAGRRFLASSPIALDAPEPASPAPVRRILRAVEAGCVLVVASAGLLGISRMVEAVSKPMLALGVLALALGLGFMLAAGASYFLSRRMGLIDSSRSPEQV